MREGSPRGKRDRKGHIRLVRQGVLVPENDPEVYCFFRDQHFGSSRVVRCIVKDGNCSGTAWTRTEISHGVVAILIPMV